MKCLNCKNKVNVEKLGFSATCKICKRELLCSNCGSLTMARYTKLENKHFKEEHFQVDLR